MLGISIVGLLVACTPQPAAAPTPTPTPPPQVATATGETTTPPTSAADGSCSVVAAGGLTAYKRPSLDAEIFGQLPDDSPLPIAGQTQEGWIGFDPGVAQAGNVGIFRLRWLPPGSGSLTGSCSSLPTLPTLPANVCFTMAMGEQPVYAAASEASAVVATLQLNAYASVVSRTPDGWLELNLNESSLGMGGAGWLPATAANFNGPCSRYAPPLHAAPPPRLASGTAVELDSIQMVDPSRGWAIGGIAGADRRILRTQDGGLQWIDVSPPEPAAGTGSEPKQASADFHPDGTARVAYWYSEPARAPLVLSLWLSRNWGETWQSAGLRYYSDLAEDEPLLDFNAQDDGYLLLRFFVGMGSHAYALLASDDGGQNYATRITPTDSVDTCQRTALVASPDGSAWITGACPFLVQNGALLEIVPARSSEPASIGLPTPGIPDGLSSSVLYCEAVDPQLFSAGRTYLVVRCLDDSGGHPAAFLYRSDDGAASWSSLDFPGEAAFFLDPDSGWALGNDISWTADGGLTWQLRKQVIWSGEFSFVDARNGWAVARAQDELALVRTDDGGATWSLIEPQIAGE